MYLETLDRSSDLIAGPLSTSRSLTTDFVLLIQEASSIFVTESCIDVLRSANQLIGQDKYSWSNYVGVPSKDTNSICGPHQTFILVGGTHEPWLMTSEQLDRIKPAIRNAARVGIIGAGVFVDGQVLVLHDMLGLTNGLQPKFVRSFFSMSKTIEQAVKNYISAVRNKEYPSSEHSY